MNYKKTILFIFFLVLTVPYATFYTGSINMVKEAYPLATGGDDMVYLYPVNFMENRFLAGGYADYGPFTCISSIFTKTLAFHSTKTDQGYLIFIHYLTTVLPLLLGLYLFIHKTTQLKLIENKEGRTPLFPFVFAMGIIVAFMYFFLRRVPLDTNHLASIFIMMSIFSLAQDNLRLKKHFTGAWVFWGIAFYIHFFSISFAVPMGVYLLLVLIKGDISFKEILKKFLQHLGVFLIVSLLVYFYTPTWDLKHFIRKTMWSVGGNQYKHSFVQYLTSYEKMLLMFFFMGGLSLTCFKTIIKKFKQEKSCQTALLAIFLSSIFVSVFIGTSFLFYESQWVVLKRMGIILFPLLIISLLGFSSFFKKKYLAVIYLCSFTALTLLQAPEGIPLLLDMFKRHHQGSLSQTYQDKHKATLVLDKLSKNKFFVQQGFKAPYRYWRVTRSFDERIFPENLHQIYNRKTKVAKIFTPVTYKTGWLSAKRKNSVQFIIVKNTAFSSKPFSQLLTVAQKSQCGKKMKDISGFNKIPSRFQVPNKKEWLNTKLIRYLEPFKHPYEKELQQANYVLYVWRKCP